MNGGMRGACCNDQGYRKLLKKYITVLFSEFRWVMLQSGLKENETILGCEVKTPN
jgi:hypothetical protein